MSIGAQKYDQTIFYISQHILSMGKNPLQVLKGGLIKLKETVKNRRNLVCECRQGEEMMEINGGERGRSR